MTGTRVWFRRVHRCRRVLVIGLVLALLLVGNVERAAAHGDDGAMDVLASRPSGDASILIEVSIPFEDGDLAENAVVTATLTGPDSRIPDVPLPRTSSLTASYAADIEVPRPGTWLIALRSTSPVAEATVQVQVRGDSAATAPEGGGRSTWIVSLLGSAGVGLGLVAARRRMASSSPSRNISRFPVTLSLTRAQAS